MALRLSFLFAAILLYASVGFSMAPAPELTQPEFAKLANRELIIHSREIPECPWPEFTVFALIDVSPAEAAALFANYQDQKRYIPDLVKSDPVKKIAANETIVRFEMRLPWPLANSKYSTGNVLNRLDDNEYEIIWYLVESNCLTDSRGAVQFRPYGKKTILKYQSLIHPDSRLATVFASKAKNGITKTVQAIVTYLEEPKRKDPHKTQQLVDALLR